MFLSCLVHTYVRLGVIKRNILNELYTFNITIWSEHSMNAINNAVACYLFGRLFFRIVDKMDGRLADLKEPLLYANS